MTPTYLAQIAAQHGLDPEKFAEAVRQIQEEQTPNYRMVMDESGLVMLRGALEIGHGNGTGLYTFPPAAQVPPDGWVMVPKVPTDEMRDAGNEIIKDRIRLFQVWHSMLRSAPEYKE